MVRRVWFVVVLAVALTGRGIAQNRVDTVTLMAPELASVGRYAIGVRTIEVTDRNRPDIVNTRNGAPTARYDRSLTLEVWYPAAVEAGRRTGGEYRVITRDPSIIATLRGQAIRDAAPLGGEGPFPLVIVSHGHPGNRFLLSHLTENLASKGYIVVSIDHRDSTYADQQSFPSTLYNRPFDQLFVLNEIARSSRPGSASFLSGLVDVERTGLVGYSMGGYGVVNVIGGGFSKASTESQSGPPNGLLAERGADNPDYRRSRDARIKAAVAIAPWGMPGGYWDADGLKGVTTPVMFVAGSVDEVAGYERGTRAIFEGAVNADRYLLTFVNAGHNAGAPIPAPVETYPAAGTTSTAFAHYADPVWDTVRMNNILDHFATAYFDVHLKADQSRQVYLDLMPDPRNAVYSVDREGNPNPTHTYWKGFRPRTAVGLTFEHRAPGESR